jgi:hypothetical protein
VLEAYKKTVVQPYSEEQQSLDAAQKYVRDEIVFWGKVVRDNDVKIARCAPARPGTDRVEPF